MTASSSPVSLANRSLLQVGARAQISSLTENSVEANAINVLFVPTFESLARSAPWNCLRKQIAMTLLQAAQGTPENPQGSTLPLPPTPWLYAYQVPADSLQIRFIVPSQVNSTPNGMVPISTVNNLANNYIAGAYDIPFAVAYSTDTQGNPVEVVLTNLSQAQVVYTVNQPSPGIWDSLFEQAFVSSLAAFLAPALSLNIPLMKIAIATAQSAITQARVRDGDEGSTSQNRNASWMVARTTGWVNGAYGTGYNNNLYSDICWPSV